MKTNILQAKKALLVLFALLPLVASAEKVEIDGIWYNLVPKAKQAEVTFKGDYYHSYSDEYSGSITLPTTVTHNGVEYSVTSIGEYAFQSCGGLKSITIPEGVTSIGKWAFSYCLSLTTITIPEGVTSIGVGTFSNCSRLTAITLPEGVTSISDWAFDGCSSLTAITIPESVTSIRIYAFSGCSSLKSITIPEGVTSIEGYTFEGCSSLTAITLPEGVTSIEYSAFEGCSSLTAITLPEGVTSIGDEAFSGCSSLTTVVLPKSVKDIYSEAFAGCPELTDVYCYAESVPSTATDAFDGSYPEYATLHVPADAINSYKATAPWSSFDAIIALGASITEITLSESSATLTEGEDLTLTMTTNPENADRNLISWSSSKPSVATVDNTGKVTAVAPGTATITATANDGSGVSASCEVTVEKKIVTVSSITLSQTTATLTEGETLVLTATVTPEDADDKSISWSSSNPIVATVDNTGKVTAVAPGTSATITATANDGSGVSASCVVEVKEKFLGKCATPTISYVDGKVELTCKTEGAKVITTTTDCNANKFEEFKFDFIPAYTLTAYATKEKYEDSDEVTLTLCWLPCTKEHKEDEGSNEEGEEEDNSITIPSKPVLISTQGGTITVSGLAAGTAVAAYSTAGTELATATATDGTATLATNLEAGSIAIVKIGDYSIKVAIK